MSNFVDAASACNSKFSGERRRIREPHVTVLQSSLNSEDCAGFGTMWTRPELRPLLATPMHARAQPFAYPAGTAAARSLVCNFSAAKTQPVPLATVPTDSGSGIDDLM